VAVAWAARACTRPREVAVSEEGVWRSKSAGESKLCFASNGGGATACMVAVLYGSEERPWMVAVVQEGEAEVVVCYTCPMTDAAVRMVART
jgi:hypothetical protein